jgi:hypothetical protein
MTTYLLPLLLLKQDLLDLDAFWSPVGNSSKIASVILDIAKDPQQQKEDKLSEIVGTIRAPVLPQSKQNPNKYPNAEAIWYFPGRQKSQSISSF